VFETEEKGLPRMFFREMKPLRTAKLTKKSEYFLNLGWVLGGFKSERANELYGNVDFDFRPKKALLLNRESKR